MTAIPNLNRRLRLNQLQLVDEVARTGSLGEAAKGLHITRAAVSKSLRELEELLDARLFERSVQGMTPTPAGLKVARHARLLFNELEHMRQELAGGVSATAVRLRLGMPPYVATHVAPALLAKLCEARRGTELTVHVHDGQLHTLIEQLLRAELDVVMALYAPQAVAHMDLGMLEVQQFEPVAMVVVASPQLKIRVSTPWGWDALAHHPWILPHPNTHLRLSVEHMFNTLGRPAPAPTIESNSLAANVQYAVAGLGLAVVPMRSAQAEIDAGRLRVLNVRPALPPTSVVLIYRKASAIYLGVIQQLADTVRQFA